VVVLQTGLVGVVQSVLATHSTQDPALAPLVSHTCPPVQSPFPLHARQVLVPVSQIGLGAAQSALVLQSTQVNVMVSQCGVMPMHAVMFVPSHCTQSPLFAPLVSQTAFGAMQSDAEHARHVSVVVLQKGVPPVQPVVFDCVHCTHSPARVPLVSHAGVAPVQSPDTQARQVFVPTSQIGVLGVGLQSVFVVQVTSGPWTTQSACAFDHSVCM
jgi:hypothetical protein